MHFSNLKEKYLKRYYVIRVGIAIIIILLINFYCIKFRPVKCESDDPKVIELYKVNNEINNAISWKNWEKIYEMKMEAYNAGITYIKSVKKDFINDIKNWSFIGIYNIKLVAYNINGDEAKTTNYCIARVAFFPFIRKKINWNHYWEFSEGRWYLIDWGRGGVEPNIDK